MRPALLWKKARKIYYKKKKLQANIPVKNRCKLSAKYQQTEFNSTLKRSYSMTKWDLSLGCKDGLIYANQ